MLILPDGQQVQNYVLSPAKHILFPGSFNPLHDGHKAIAKLAATKTGKEVVFAISSAHPVKGTLERGEVLRRANAFQWFGSVLLTENDGLYLDKMYQFPAFDFIIGADTLRTIVRWEDKGEITLTFIKACGNKFYVNPRGEDTINSVLEEFKLMQYRELFVELSSTPFPQSSSLIRVGK